MGKIIKKPSGHAEAQLGKEYTWNAVAKYSVDWASSSWKSRGYLPHYDSLGMLQSITFRLADSLPENTLLKLQAKLDALPANKQEIQKRIQIENLLDSGYGSCALQNFEMAQIMESTLIKFHNERYNLIAWCIMPNHVHVLIEAKDSLSKIIQSWKSYTGKWAFKNNDRLKLGLHMQKNAELGLGVPRKFWMRDYWDRFIRDDSHFNKTVEYIHQNPVKAGLCENAEDWIWSSARPLVKR